MGQPMTIGALEAALLASYPAADACSWDRTGLLVGDPAVAVEGVAIALDPTIGAMREALAAGANVLVTHHPVYLDPVAGFAPFEVQGETPGSCIAFALSHGLALMNFHTALDASAAGLAALPKRLGLRPLEPLEPLSPGSQKGFCVRCDVDATAPLTADELALRAQEVLGGAPRVWGDGGREVVRVACSGGSAADFLPLCLAEGIECLVCGEVKYHPALAAANSGLVIIELGHDVSENVLCEVLAADVAAVGIPCASITMVGKRPNWHVPAR